MGIGFKEATEVMNDLKLYEDKLNMSLCELGNNYLKGDKLMEWLKVNGIILPKGGEQHPKGVVSKLFWESLGFNHTSIDMNGLDGSLKLDLRKELPKDLHNKFDIIYDGGTGEHVDNQYMCFKNVHDITKIGGIMIHVLPKVGHFPDHCQYYFTKDSFNVLEDLCNYKKIRLFEHEADGGIMIWSVLEKTQNDFISKKEFQKVPIQHEAWNFGDRSLYPYAYN